MGVGVGGGQDSDCSLSRPLSGNRKATRSDFKAAVLAAIPALTLLDPSAHTPAAPFLRRSAVPVPPLPRSFLLSFLTGTLRYLLSRHVREVGRSRSVFHEAPIYSSRKYRRRFQQDAEISYKQSGFTLRELTNCLFYRI